MPLGFFISRLTVNLFSKEHAKVTKDSDGNTSVMLMLSLVSYEHFFLGMDRPVL